MKTIEPRGIGSARGFRPLEASNMSAKIIDQATALRAMVQDGRRATVIAITSGKGGVGKSNVAVNLAIKLSAAGKEVVLLDADLGLANADVLCNIDLPFNLSHVISRKKELKDVVVRAPGGFRLIGGASGLARMADLSDRERQRIVDSLGRLEMDADVILIDTGAGISPNVLAFTRAADHVLVVTNPEPTAITDAYAVIKVLSRDGLERRISLFVNHVRTAAEANGVHERIAKVARQFLGVTVYDGGHMLFDEQVIEAGAPAHALRAGQPTLPGQRLHGPVGGAACTRRGGRSGRRVLLPHWKVASKIGRPNGQTNCRHHGSDRLRPVPGHGHPRRERICHNALARTQGDGRDFFRRAAGRSDGTTHVKRKFIGLDEKHRK